jgi:threonine synthase
MKYVTGGRCVVCGAVYEAAPGLTTCEICGAVLEIEYDYGLIRSAVDREAISARKDPSMWRYREFLPVEAESDTGGLRVGGSPLYRARRLGDRLGLPNLYIKDDGLNPTSSLKDRASAMAVVKAAEAGADTVACSSTGNAASSLAGAAAARGMRTYIFVPSRAPKGKLTQLLIFGAKVISVQGGYDATFRLSSEAIERWGWYNRNAAVNPYLSEGKKTVAFEIAEQLGWRAPDYVALSVGDGCTIAGVWKGFRDLREAGFIDRLPKLISVQAEGCCPVNNAVEKGSETLEPMEENTLADSIAVGVPRNFLKAVRAIRESGGLAVNVSDAEILEAMATIGRTEGVFGEPAGVAAGAGVAKLAAAGRLPKGAAVVSIVTGNGLKDIANAQKAVAGPIQVEPSMDALLEAFRREGGPE